MMSKQEREEKGGINGQAGRQTKMSQLDIGDKSIDAKAGNQQVQDKEKDKTGMVSLG